MALIWDRFGSPGEHTFDKKTYVEGTELSDNLCGSHYGRPAAGVGPV